MKKERDYTMHKYNTDARETEKSILNRRDADGGKRRSRAAGPELRNI